jgi:hypothetical protein
MAKFEIEGDCRIILIGDIMVGHPFSAWREFDERY